MNKKIKQIVKTYDLDLKLYLDIEKELRLNLNLSKKIFLRDLDIKINDCYKTYYIYIKMKQKEINNLLERLRKSLNIISITKFIN